ncbi:MAG: hypothetical protein JWO10_854, partial [Microbacteriaceae bacterium]|nr:hypothetical protein [Microbacteriaceae bacterium]
RKIMHGGISICAVDVEASAVLVAEVMPPLATSSLRLCYTRPVMDGDAFEYRATPHHRCRTLGIVEVRSTVAGRTVALAHVVANPLD